MPMPGTLPPSAGVGLKPRHYREALEQRVAGTPSGPGGDAPFIPAWFEVHPQNYVCEGGPPHRWLTAFADCAPLSFHSVGLSPGSAQGCLRDELDRLAALCERYAPAQVSEHLSWSGTADNRYPDLLPLPYTHEALDHVARQIGLVQDRLRRPILIENPSRYLAFAHDEMSEGEFLRALCRKAGCGLLLDINNIEVSATNTGADPFAMLAEVDPATVGEVHLAGHATEWHRGTPLLIDDHGSPVSDLTWRLYETFIARAGPVATLIEWDTDVPEYDVLCAEAAKAQAILDRAGLDRTGRRHAA